MPRVRAVRRLTALVTSAALAGATVAVTTEPLVAEAAPSIRITKVVGSLSRPWDLTWVGGVMLFDQRGGTVWSKRGGAPAKKVSLPLPPVFAQNEGGLLGIVADPRAATNKYFYTCMAVATASGRPRDVQVWKWKLTSDTRAAKVKVLIKGIPLTSGRHSGCRLRFRSTYMLYVGTGDAASSANPQNLSSLGGKVLRVRSDGTVPSGNPFSKRKGNARYIWSYGHRNVQGLVLRPGTTQMWSVEQGTSRDDEINRVLKGHNYGWDPRPGAYNESRPMTDKGRYPKATSAKWRSGSSTVATCGATFISGSRWGSWNGRLAVAMLKGEGILLFTVDKNDRVTKKQEIATSYGRIRTVQQGPDGALYFTTSNGSSDGIYKITAR